MITETSFCQASYAYRLPILTFRCKNVYSPDMSTFQVCTDLGGNLDIDEEARSVGRGNKAQEKKKVRITTWAFQIVPVLNCTRLCNTTGGEKEQVPFPSGLHCMLVLT